MKEQIIKDFFEFLKFKTISSDPDCKEEMIRASLWLKNYLTNFLEVEIINTSIHPLVFAKSKFVENAPTVLFYGHYDVQPADPIDLWVSDPFQPRLHEKRVFARGSSDDKGQLFTFLPAIKEWISEGGGNLNIKILLDGEEEVASKSLFEKLPELREKLACDYLLVVDFDMLDEKTPAITLGARGIIPIEIEIENGTKDVHSGAHGGVILNPLKEMVFLLQKLWDKEGHIAIDHLYDDVDSAETSLYEMAFDEKKYKEEFGVRVISVEKNMSPKEALWFRPSIEINGLFGGHIKEGVKTVIPSKAYAKLSCRLVPHQDPIKVGELISSFLKKNLTPGLKISIKIHQGGEPFREEPRHLATIVSKAYEAVFKKECKKILAGGSVPISYAIKKLIGCEFVGMGFSLLGDDIHSPNEHFDLDRLEKGFMTIKEILKMLVKF